MNIFWAFGSYHLNLSMREAADKGTQGLSAQKKVVSTWTHTSQYELTRPSHTVCHINNDSRTFASPLMVFWLVLCLPSKVLNVYDFGMKMYISQPIIADLSDSKCLMVQQKISVKFGIWKIVQRIKINDS